LTVKLYKEEKHTIREICQMMGISKPTLYGYLKKANSKLRKAKNS
jgi:predicted DNA binding protein